MSYHKTFDLRVRMIKFDTLNGISTLEHMGIIDVQNEQLS